VREEEECRPALSLRLGIAPDPGLRIGVGEEGERHPFLSPSPVVGEEDSPLLGVGVGDTEEREAQQGSPSWERSAARFTVGVLRHGDRAPVGTRSPLLTTQIIVYAPKSEMGIEK
jgi:hypothetical protein